MQGSRDYHSLITMKGYAALAGKVIGVGLSGLVLNYLLWGDDEEYEDEGWLNPKGMDCSKDFPMCSCIESGSLDDFFEDLDKGFSDTLFDYIDAKGITDVEAYKRSNVSRKVFSKIKCNKGYQPSKMTAVSFAIGLRLNLEETEHLLSTAGMCLSRSSKFDVIIEYFIKTGKYQDIHEVKETLYQYDQVLLGC